MAVLVPAWPDVACVQSHEAPWFFYVSAPWAVVVLVVFSSWLCSCAPWVFSSWLCFCAPCAFFCGCLLFPPYEGVFGTFSEDWFRYASRSG